jgi:four helix bundle protein
MKIEKFENLEIWQKAIDLYVEVYHASENGKLAKDFSAKDQLKRAALSISNNIAEGYEYDNNPDFIKFLKYSKGSAGEVRSMFHAFHRTGQINDLEHERLVLAATEISKKINGFIKYLKDYQRK